MILGMGGGQYDAPLIQQGFSREQVKLLSRWFERLASEATRNQRHTDADAFTAAARRLADESFRA